MKNNFFCQSCSKWFSINPDKIEDFRWDTNRMKPVCPYCDRDVNVSFKEMKTAYSKLEDGEREKFLKELVGEIRATNRVTLEDVIAVSGLVKDNPTDLEALC